MGVTSRVTNTARRRRPYPIHPSTETHLSRGRRDRRSRPRRGGRQGMGRGASAWNFRGGGGLAALRVEPRARTGNMESDWIHMKSDSNIIFYYILIRIQIQMRILSDTNKNG